MREDFFALGEDLWAAVGAAEAEALRDEQGRLFELTARADRHGIFEGVAKGGYGRKKRGTVRARYRRERSVPFSLKPVRDFWQPPFGKPVQE